MRERKKNKCTPTTTYLDFEKKTKNKGSGEFQTILGVITM
jgi:hypothetical protein